MRVTTLRQEQSDEVWLNLDCEEKSTEAEPGKSESRG